jgi:hypothetical protein
MGLEDALAHYKRYFNEKIEVHGAVPEGVDYNGPEAQSLRFEQLVRVIDVSEPCEVIDYGCGYGGPELPKRTGISGITAMTC